MQNSLFDLQNRYASLSEAGDPLERLNAVIDWEMFRPLLERIDIKEPAVTISCMYASWRVCNACSSS